MSGAIAEYIPPTEPNIEAMENLRSLGFRISNLTNRFRSSFQMLQIGLTFMRFIVMIYCLSMTINRRHIIRLTYWWMTFRKFGSIFHPKIGILFNQPWNKNFEYPQQVTF